MAWQDTLLDASFRGVVFDCQTVADAGRRDVQRHAYPYVAGEDTEDLGRGALEISIAALFWGRDYEARLQAFMAVLEMPGPGELIHPVFGSVPHAQVEHWRIEHGFDAPDSCRVSVVFCQGTTAAPLFVRQLPGQQMQRVASLAQGAWQAGSEAFARRVQGFTGWGGAWGAGDGGWGFGGVGSNTRRANSLRSTLNGVLDGVWRIAGLGGMKVAALDMLAFPRTFTSRLAEGVKALAAQRTFNAVTLTADWAWLVGAGHDIVTLPQTFAQNGLQADDSTMIEAVLAAKVACGLADVAGDVLAGEVDAPTLSPIEIEGLVNDVRRAIQDAIDLHRQAYPIEVSRPITEPLKDVALAVQQAGIAVIDLRPPLVKRTVDAPTNLHLLAFHCYGDYTRAQELARLNPGLRHPNFLRAGEVLHAWQR